jgi:hypothetical protein
MVIFSHDVQYLNKKFTELLYKNMWKENDTKMHFFLWKKKHSKVLENAFKTT